MAFLCMAVLTVHENPLTVLSLINAPGALQIEGKKAYYSITSFSTSPIFCYEKMGRNKEGALIRGRALIRDNTVIDLTTFAN